MLNTGDIAFMIASSGLVMLMTPGLAPGPYAPTIPHLLFAAFQLMFAIITPALITGAIAERMKFSAFILFTRLWTILVYFPLCHWIWGGGWLAKLGVMEAVPLLSAQFAI